MNKVLIGSQAMLHHFPEFNRKPKDSDYAVVSNYFKLKGDDCMVIPLVCRDSHSRIATPEMLLTLKLSHIFFDTHWDKHMWDIQFLLSKGVGYDLNLMLELKDFWTEHYGGLYRSDLTLSSKDFFDNAVACPIPHDDIHEIISSAPTYKSVLKDGADVEPCPEKYNQLSSIEKDALFQEEVMVMAYERWPDKFYKEAYFIMAKKYIRNHVPMFALDYVVNNWIKLSRAPFDFISLINSKK